MITRITYIEESQCYASPHNPNDVNWQPSDNAFPREFGAYFLDLLIFWWVDLGQLLYDRIHHLQAPLKQKILTLHDGDIIMIPRTKVKTMVMRLFRKYADPIRLSTLKRRVCILDRLFNHQVCCNVAIILDLVDMTEQLERKEAIKNAQSCTLRTTLKTISA